MQMSKNIRIKSCNVKVNEAVSKGRENANDAKGTNLHKS